MDRSSISTFASPFRNRPWMANSGAAASSGGSKSLKGIIAGAFTGGIETTITYPTEFVKTHLQLDEKGDRKKYNGIIDCVKKTMQKRGFFGLYRGLSVLIYGSVPKAASRFGAFELLRTYMVQENGQLSNAGKLLCGLGAGTTEAIVAVTPMETIKVKFINDRRSANPQYKGFLHGVRMIIKQEGIRGIYKGLMPTIVKQGTNQAMRFFVMENLKDLYKKGDQKKTVPTWLTGIFGIIAGAVSVYGNTPVDVVKTRMQGLEAHKYKNSLDCVTQILRNEGLFAFYKGTVPRLGRVCLAVAITFMIYDKVMELFKKVWPD